MSDFFESYYLRSSNSQDAYNILMNTGLHGYIFSPSNGWTQFVAEGIPLTMNPAVAQVNPGILIHMIYAGDHGWEFMVFHQSKQIAKYSCRWDFGLRIESEGDINWLFEQLNIQSTTLDEILFPAHQDGIALEQAQPEEALCKLIGLRSIDSISYRYINMYPQIYRDMDHKLIVV